MVALLLVALIGMLGIVIDLSNLYIRKTELQNAADAAALAGVKKLNGEPAGIDAAVAAAIALAAANGSDFARTPVAIAEAQIRFSTEPYLPEEGKGNAWVDATTAKANPSGLSYIKIDTSGIAQGTRPTWFMRVLNSAVATTTAGGVAVAGAPICEGTPMFMCSPVGGFEPGRSYYFLSDPSIVGYFDPVPPDAPNLIPPGASEMADIVCVGKTFCIGGGTYSSRTQAAFGKMEKAFNTRFGDFKGELKDSYAACRSDTNVREYTPSNVAWMDAAGDQLNVHWSAVRPEAMPGDPAITGAYPDAGSGDGTPYTQTESTDPGKTFQEPPMPLYQPFAQPGRRIITVGLADPSVCDAGGKIGIAFQGANKPIPIKNFGRFLMQAKYDKGLYLEYIDSVSSLRANAPDIKLFR